MTDIYLVRHGETYAKINENEIGKPFVCGSGSEISRNTRLTPVGKKQMFGVGEKYKDTRFDVVVVSDLLRSLESAEAFLLGAKQEDLMKSLMIEPRVTEINYGHHDGVEEEIVKKAKSTFYEVLHPELSGNFDYNFDFKYRTENNEIVFDFEIERKSESFKQAGERMLKVLMELGEKYPNKKILIISHSGSIRSLFLTGLLQSVVTEIGKDLDFGVVIPVRIIDKNLVLGS